MYLTYLEIKNNYQETLQNLYGKEKKDGEFICVFWCKGVS